MVSESMPDRSLYSDLFRQLQNLLLSYALRQHEFSRHLGLNDTDLHAANILRSWQTLSAGELAHRLGVTTAGITAVLDRLETCGYAHRFKDPADRRRTLVSLGPLFPPLQGPGTLLFRCLYEFYCRLDEPSRDIFHTSVARMNTALASPSSFTSSTTQPLEQTS